MSEFEKAYLDVLQNIEFAIVSVYRQQSKLTDYDVDKALKTLEIEYKTESLDRSVNVKTLNTLPQIVYERAKEMCDWRLGRGSILSDGEGSTMILANPKTAEEIVLCIKRIRKSIERWNKRGGRHGYLRFVEQYVR